MNSKVAEQILDELAPTFEHIESQSTAILQFLKEKGMASDAQLAPYLQQASAASSVRWRALRVRMGRLLSMAEKNEDDSRAKQVSEEKSAKKAEARAQVADAKTDKPDHEPGKASGSEKRAEAGAPNARADQGENDREPPRPRESAQKQTNGLTTSAGTGQPADHAPAARKEKDAA